MSGWLRAPFFNTLCCTVALFRARTLVRDPQEQTSTRTCPVRGARAWVCRGMRERERDELHSSIHILSSGVSFQEHSLRSVRLKLPVSIDGRGLPGAPGRRRGYLDSPLSRFEIFGSGCCDSQS
eukprot:1048354-Prymnesium_polylepis.1